MSQIDFTGDQQIHYSEFLAATMDIKKFLTDSKLKAIFKQFDTDGSGEKATKKRIPLCLTIVVSHLENLLRVDPKTSTGLMNHDFGALWKLFGSWAYCS